MHEKKKLFITMSSVECIFIIYVYKYKSKYTRHIDYYYTCAIQTRRRIIFISDKCDIVMCVVGKNIRITKMPTTNTLKVGHQLFAWGPKSSHAINGFRASSTLDTKLYALWKSLNKLAANVGRFLMSITKIW